MSENQNSGKAGLDRYLSRIDTWAMAFGVMVGWGTFVMPATTFLPVAGLSGTIIAFLISTVIMLIIGNNFAFLMIRSTRTGGVYSYTKDAFGRDHAFIASWFLCLSYLTIVFLNGSSVFVVIRALFGDSVQRGAFYTVGGNQIYILEVAVSALVLAGVAVLCIKAKSALQRLHTVLSITLFAGVLLTFLLCLPHGLTYENLAAQPTGGVNRIYGIFSLIILAPWAFVGFEVISFDTAHFNFPIKKARRNILVALLCGAFCYVALTVISVSAVPEGFSSLSDYINAISGLTGIQSVPSFYAAKTAMGTVGLVIIAITALAAILTGIIGAYRASLRILSTMAEDRILSDIFSHTSTSILFVMILSMLISLVGRNTLSWFIDLTAFGAIIGFGYTSAAAYKLSKAENNRKYQITGLIGAIISALFAIVQLVPRLTAMEAMGSEAFLLLALWCLIGFVFYWRTIMHSTLSEYSGMSVSGVVLFALLIYSTIMWVAKDLYELESVEAIRAELIKDGAVLLVIIFVGLVVMLYVQNLVRQKHEAVEREKIRAVEGSLAKSQFLFNMSHDIRTPMNAIIGYTNLAQKEPNTPEVQEYLSKINSSSQHLLSLINDILEMSRIESGKIELEFVPTDLCGIIDEMNDLFAEQMKEKDIDFSIHTSQVHNRLVWCDKKNLTRVLLNILSNAFKFTPAGGTVTASIWDIGGEDNGYCSYEIRVQDSGIGMSREFADKMFNAFERERTSTVSGIQGTGLGLSITKSLVDLMGGTIEVLTSPGSGTEFIIRLKFKLANPEDFRDETTDAPEIAQKAVDFNGKRVLLVEDNAINMEIAEMLLTQVGFTVESAENGKEAVDMVSASAPGYYDLVLMDIQMPVMDGYEATSTIRKLENKSLANIPIVAMTANAFREDEQAAMNVGMQAHIAKPLDVDKMMKTIANVLGN